jgi:hypothetical protein
MTEKSGVWDTLRKGCPQVQWMRLENLVGTGMPDVNGCLNGVEVWLELKYVASGFKIHFQPTQPPWIFRRALSGGRVYVLARKEDVLYLYHGSQIRELVAQGLRLQPILRLEKPFDWYLLLSVVFGHKATESLKP